MTRTLLLAAAALAAAAPTLTLAEDGGRKFSIALTGAAERPGPGDPDGSGAADLRVNPGQSQVCWDVTYADIGTPVAAHIHIGGADVAGPVVVNFGVNADGTIAGCRSISRELAMALIQTPERYYVNVHTAAFPGGAIRGQLAKK